MIRIRVLAWGSAAEALGWADRELSLAPGTTVGQLLSELAAHSARLAENRFRVRLAVNQQYAPPETALAEGDEVALIPPVSGGADSSARLVREPIDTAALVREVEHASCGAIATFAGIVRHESQPDGRPLEALEYTAFEPMALVEMERICSAVRRRYDMYAAVLVHRLGILGIGEASVVVVVSAAHRAASFDACREIVEALKRDVPIFKKEVWRGGATTWVNGI